MDCQPDGQLIGRCPLYAMAPVGGDVDRIARVQCDDCPVILKPQSRGALEHQHPFVLVLIVPEPGWRRMPPRDNPLDAQSTGLQQRLDQFVRHRGRDVGKEVLHKEAVRFRQTTKIDGCDILPTTRAFCRRSPIRSHHGLFANALSLMLAGRVCCRGSVPPGHTADATMTSITLGAKGTKPRAIVLGAAGRPNVVREAERLRPLIERYVAVLVTDFRGEVDLGDIEADVAIVLGGDGSILRAAQQMGKRQLPVIAVNLGKLGFLADVSPARTAEGVLQDFAPASCR